MSEKSGVSLVILMVTIVIMIILSSVVILNVSSSDNQISQTQAANIMSEINVFNDELNLNLSKNPRKNLNDIKTEDMKDYIPTMTGRKTINGVLYSDVLIIDKGELKLYDKNNLLEQEEKDAILKVIKEYKK